jgi:uncharacterized membrane protein
MTFQFLIAIAAAAWLASLAACAIAAFAKRLWLSLILCLTALAIGYLGLTRVHLSGSKTIDGHVQWSLDSRWFFIATLILAALTLIYTLWKRPTPNPIQ